MSSGVKTKRFFNTIAGNSHCRPYENGEVGWNAQIRSHEMDGPHT
jgi:hypothetical protein